MASPPDLICRDHRFSGISPDYTSTGPARVLRPRRFDCTSWPVSKRQDPAGHYRWKQSVAVHRCFSLWLRRGARGGGSFRQRCEATFLLRGTHDNRTNAEIVLPGDQARHACSADEETGSAQTLLTTLRRYRFAPQAPAQRRFQWPPGRRPGPPRAKPGTRSRGIRFGRGAS